jgi:hypothetical protein
MSYFEYICKVCLINAAILINVSSCRMNAMSAYANLSRIAFKIANRANTSFPVLIKHNSNKISIASTLAIRNGLIKNNNSKVNNMF